VGLALLTIVQKISLYLNEPESQTRWPDFVGYWWVGHIPITQTPSEVLKKVSGTGALIIFKELPS